MSDWLPVLGILAGVINIASAIPYFYSVHKGITKPERASNLIWFVTTMIIFVTNLAEGAEESMWFLVGDVIVVTMMLIYSVWRGYRWVHGRDVPGLVLASIGIILWMITGDPLIALLLSIFVDAIAAVLVLIKSYEAPKTENLLSWEMYLLASILATISVGKINFELLVYPVYSVIMSLAICFVIIFRNNKKLGVTKKGKQSKNATS